MTRKVTFGDLRRLLTLSGFEQVPVDGPYVVLEHGSSGALQAFRMHRLNETPDPMTIASVRKTLVANGFYEPEEFEGALRNATEKSAPRAKRK
jgi:hypothetical protein